VGFVVHKLAVGQVFSNCFSFTLTDALQAGFHIPVSSRVGTIVMETQHINVSCTVFIDINFRRRIKSRLPFAGIIRSSPYSTRFQDKG
jgi:hypothetical protein